jgi:phytoene synthase
MNSPADRFNTNGVVVVAQDQALETSYQLCELKARQAASNFYWAFRWLPRDKRRGMCALYAFSRETDDLGDSDASVEDRREALTRWRASLQRALAGQQEGHIWPALADTARRFDIPEAHLMAIVDGVAMDLTASRYETFGELRKYCYHVASAVGLACIHIWGFHDPQARTLADDCGVALQLTNILRDLHEDAQRDRMYLPLEDLRRFDYTVDELFRGVQDDRYRALIRFEVERAEEFFYRGRTILPYLHEDGRRTCALMLATYHQLLAEIKKRQGDVFHRRIRLTRWQKLRVLASSLWGVRS